MRLKSELIFAIFLCEIYFPLAIVDFRDSTPIRFGKFNAVCLHPSINEFVISLAYVLELVEVVPQLYNETSSDSFLQCEGGTRWQIVVCPDILVLECGYVDSCVCRQGAYRGGSGLWLQEQLQDVAFGTASCEAYGMLTALLVDEPLCKVWL